MKKIIRIVLISICTLVIVIIAGIAGKLIYMINSPMPEINGTIKIEGLKSTVEIIRDDFGVPHIYADNPHDLFLAQGYVHAQDRFVQMEFGRRLAYGRLSEIFGSMVIEVDRFIKIVGFPRIIEMEVANLDDETREILQAYSKGVNAYISTNKHLGLELELLGVQGIKYTPEPWQISDSVSWLKVMALNISANMNTELRNVEIIQSLGMEAIQEIWPLYSEDKPLIIPPEISYENIKLNNYYAQNEVFEKALTIAGVGIGSNSWAISGELTDTGKPYLANDPHLGIQMPSIWYEVGLHCTSDADGFPYNLAGVSFAGMPGIIIGHNDRIAWGFTILPADIQDLYIERVNPENPNQYEVDGEWVDFEIINETILVRGKLDQPEQDENRNPPLKGVYNEESGFTTVDIPVYYTRHGPVINNFSKEVRKLTGKFGSMEIPEMHVTSLKWTALYPTNTIKSIYKLNRARNFDEFRDALSYFDNPAQNVVYADIDGNIGFQTPGKIPIRKNGDGQLPVPGWNNEYEWIGYIPFDELPYSYNPKSGYIVACNNDVAGKDYPYLISLEWDPGSRAKRVIDLIKASSGIPISMEYNKKMQYDMYDMPAKEILSYLNKLQFDDDDLQQALSFLTSWDCQESSDSGEAALYAIFWVELIKTVFMNKLPPKKWPSEEAVAMLMNDPESKWWDDIETADIVENRDDILVVIFKNAYSSAEKLMGTNIDKWCWDKIHEATFKNAILGSVPVLGNLFNRGPVKVPGGPGVINSIGWEIIENPESSEKSTYQVTFVPSMRMIVDFSNLDNSLIIHTTGQSGHPFNKNYNDMIKLWKKNEYHQQLWERSSVDDALKYKLILNP